MQHHQSRLLALSLFGPAALLGGALLFAQEPEDVPVRDVKPGEPTGETVTIHRDALRLIDPQPYNQPLHLAPGRELHLSSLRYGTVQAIRTDIGERLDAQQVAIELDTTELDLELKQAEADVKVAEVELKQAGAANQPGAADLARARLAAVQAARDLANHRREQALIRTPFAGTVLDVHVVVGQVVQPGQPLVTIGDASQLKVELPVSRTDAAPGKTIDLQIDDQHVKATIDRLRPLNERFNELRNLLPTAASAVVVIDNSNGQFQRGQSVFAPTVPRQPIAEIANGTLTAGENGTRTVQVVRDETIRDIPIDVLCSIGEGRCFVSGPFLAGDELILSLSRPLADGTRVRSATAPAAGSPAGSQQRPESTSARVSDILRSNR